MTDTRHVHSFGPKGRLTCSCGITPEDYHAATFRPSSAVTLDDAYAQGWRDARVRILELLAGNSEGIAALRVPSKMPRHR